MPSLQEIIARALTTPERPTPRTRVQEPVIGSTVDREFPDLRTMEEITLGTPVKPPTGVHIDPSRPQPQVDPRLMEQWERIRTMYPFVSNLPSRVVPGRLAGPAAPRGTFHPETRELAVDLALSPEEREETMRHELVHAGQAQNQVNPWQASDEAQLERETSPYPFGPGESQAHYSTRSGRESMPDWYRMYPPEKLQGHWSRLRDLRRRIPEITQDMRKWMK